MKKRNVILLVLLLIIGFASVSTSLILNGTIGIASKQDDFDVIFTSATLDGEKSDQIIIDENKKSITFTSKRLRELNESTRLDYTIKNNSTQYGANVTVSCNTTGNDYVSIIGDFDGKSLPLDIPVKMEAQVIRNGYITAKLTKAYAGEDTYVEITCEIVATATEKEEQVEYIPDAQYTEEILNGADPVLSDELIPVNIDNDGTVTYADTRLKWYNYENQEWANAVILDEKTGMDYRANDIIKEEDIESYFVWIPRYKYQIFDVGNYASQTANSKPTSSIAKEIQIEFEGRNIEPSTGSTKGSWLTHPAFINFDVNGLWVGKFETGYKDAKSEGEAQSNKIDISKIVIKPNVYSWRYNTVSNMFKNAYMYNRDFDSHMMKNTEWGAVAYLSHSKYGINKEININNNSDYLTGYSAAVGTNQSIYQGTSGTSEDITLAYNTPTGYLASTTGNITGVYDMSGGSNEYMASYMEGYGVISHSSTNTASGFTEEDLIKYINYLDTYSNNSSSTSWNNRILGDATGEMGPFYYYADNDNYKRYHNNWYADDSHFIDSSLPWLTRGGVYNYGVLASQFNFGRNAGMPYKSIGFRIVLAP